MIPLARPGQPLIKHLLGASSKMGKLCPSLPHWAELIGLLHDYGKYRPEWVEGINKIANEGTQIQLPHHSMEGALYFLELFPYESFRQKLNIRKLALLIASHHTNLGNFEDFGEILKGGGNNYPLPDMNRSQWKIDDEYLKEVKRVSALVKYEDLNDWMSPDYRTAQRIRFLYGALIAADRQDAAMSDGWNPQTYSSIPELTQKLADWYEANFHNPTKPLDILRSDFYQECRKAADTQPGWLSVRGPCGISKTWSVMQMALDHAARWNKKKIIYCVPWTAILDQSHKQYQNVLGSKNVLGHWSTLVDPSTQDPQKLRNSRQWWETPILATTMVQLFDVLLGHSPRTAQRMPSLQNSVIVLDEVQGLPNELLITCLKVLDQLVQDFGVSIILSTATMPDYSHLNIEPKINPVEVLPQTKVEKYFNETKRVDYRWVEDPLTWETIASEIVKSQKSSTLIVSNTVAACDDAYSVMQCLPNYTVYKYTASMPPAHRTVVLAKIKEAVAQAKKSGKHVIICATSAIETGVDLDCAQGYREESGLESIVQFAGRINRNQLYDICTVTIFKTIPGSYNAPPGNDQRSERTKFAVKLGSDLHSSDVLQEYSKLLFQDANSSQEKAVEPKARGIPYDYLEALKKLKWKDVSDKWQMISPTTSILINPRLWTNSPEIIASFNNALGNANYRVLQRHCIGFHNGKYKKAKKANLIAESQIKNLEEWIGDYDLGVKV